MQQTAKFNRRQIWSSKNWAYDRLSTVITLNFGLLVMFLFFTDTNFCTGKVKNLRTNAKKTINFDRKNENNSSNQKIYFWVNCVGINFSVCHIASTNILNFLKHIKSHHNLKGIKIITKTVIFGDLTRFALLRRLTFNHVMRPMA